MEKRKSGALLAALALVALLAAGLVGYNMLRRSQMPAAAAQDASAGETSDDAVMLSDFDATVYTELGEPMRLSDIAGGRPLVVNVWATWCPYCIEEMPDLQEIYGKYGDRVAFAFVDYADGSRETVELASAWLAEHGFDDLPAYYDTGLDMVTAFGIRSFPTTVVVAADGEILTVSAGMIDPDLLSGALETLLA